jgi:hypothetical protein
MQVDLECHNKLYIDDYIIFQGERKVVQNFFENQLQFCSQNPIDVSFQIIQETIDLPTPPKHAVVRPHHLGPKGKRVLAAESNSKEMNAMLDHLEFYEVEVNVINLETLESISDAVTRK